LVVGNGDIIQGIARRIDPSWQNPNSGRTPEKTANWLVEGSIPLAKQRYQSGENVALKQMNIGTCGPECSSACELMEL
jgi:hypothetical protein